MTDTQLLLHLAALMGWPEATRLGETTATNETRWYLHPRDGILIGEAWQLGEWDGKPCYDRSWRPWRPLHAIGDAWRIVERMRTIGLHLQMNDTLSAYRARFFTVESTRNWDRESSDGAYYQFADTPQRAIVLAALSTQGAALRTEEGEG